MHFGKEEHDEIEDQSLAISVLVDCELGNHVGGVEGRNWKLRAGDFGLSNGEIGLDFPVE